MHRTPRALARRRLDPADVAVTDATRGVELRFDAGRQLRGQPRSQGIRAMPGSAKPGSRRQASGSPGRIECVLLATAIAVATIPFSSPQAAPQRRASEFWLPNGMQVVVDPRYARTGRHARGVVSRGRRRQCARPVGHRAFPRAPDVQVDQEAQVGRAGAHGVAPRRARQRDDLARCDLLFPAPSQGAPEDGDGHGGRPHAQSQSGGRRGCNRARRGAAGAPLGDRQQAARHPGRADQRQPLSQPSLPHPSDWLGA